MRSPSSAPAAPSPFAGHGPASRVARSMRRAPGAWLAFLAALTLVVLAVAPAAHAADRPFSSRFSANDTGDIDIVGNTLLTCPSSTTCAYTQGVGPTTAASSTLQNNNYNMTYVDVDSNASTFDSSRSRLELPSGSTVLFAGLYWGARTAAGTGGSAAKNAAARGTVKFQAPGDASYSAITGGVDDGTGGIYQGFADVTSRVKAAGAGTYTVADVQSSTGADTLAGWSLVVAYRDTTQPARNLSVFDGIKSIDGSSNGSISVSGFKTPPAGDVHTTVGFVTYEGDAGLVGDTATLNGKTLSDAQHPATNFFNSRSSRDGDLRTGNAPSFANNLGIEQSMLTVDKSFIPNNATSATIGLTTSGDVYAPGVVTFATELYAPKIDQTKTVTNAAGQPATTAVQGEELTYTVSGTNTGQDGATNFVLNDPLPANVAYVANSLKVTQPGGTAAGATDPAGDDVAEYDAATRTVTARLGTGATKSAGGTVPVTKGYAVSFRVKVTGPTPAVASGTKVANTATSSFASQSLGTPLTAESTATTAVRTPDLTIVKRHSGDLVRGQSGTYTIDVRNDGDAATQGAFTVRDALPAGLTATAASGAGWTCTVTAGDVSCVRATALAAGDAADTITVTVNVTDDVPSTVANSATVSGGGDGDLSNNTSTDTSLTQSRVDLGLTKTAAASDPAVGADVTYRLAVVNGGPSRSTGSTVTDTLPAGLTFVSSPDCAGSAGTSTVTCRVPALDKGATATLVVVAKPAVGTAGTTLKNTASVAGDEPDPTPGNDRSDATVAVKAVDLVVTNSIAGDPKTLQAGASAVWNVTVKNVGGSPAAGSTLAFPVPAGTTIDGALPQGCTVVTQSGAQVVACDLGTIAAGGQDVKTLAIPLKIDTANAPASVTATATATSAERDLHVDDNAATAGVPVNTAVDLAVTLASDPGTTSAGDTLTLNATVTNAGPGPAADAKLVLPIPAGTTVTKVPAGCTIGADAVTCVLDAGKLPAGGSIVVPITVKVGATPGDAIAASATVSTTGKDTDASNDRAALAVPVVKVSGLSITKTASTDQAKPGDRVVYTLTARNAGPAAAQDAVVTDTMPAGTTLVSVDDADCSTAAGTVTCDFGTIAAGGSRSAKVTVTVDPIASVFDVNATHQYSVVKREEALSIPAGSTGTVTASCAPLGPDYLATDGGVLRKATDQDHGSFVDTRVVASHATDDGTGWTATVRNSTTGQLQATVNVVCIRRTVEPVAGHTHRLIVSDPVVATRGSGQQEILVRCGPGRVAIAPGYRFEDGAGVVLGSRSEGTDWRFTVDARGAAGVTVEARCLSTTTTATNGHAHDLALRPIAQTVDVPASATTNAMTVKRLQCGDGKGIVASTTIDPRLEALGSDPQPVNRDFWFYNPTSAPVTADIGLLCLDTRSSGEIPVRDVVNTASVVTSTQDSTPAVHTASATFRATAASGPVVDTPATTAPTTTDSTPAPVPTAPAPAPAATTAAAAPVVRTAAKATVLSSALRVTGTTTKATVSVALRCATACSGTAKLVALKAVPGSKIKAGTVLASSTVRLVAGKRGTVRLVVRGALATAVRRGRVSRARLLVRTGSGALVTRTVRLVVR